LKIFNNQPWNGPLPISHNAHKSELFADVVKTPRGTVSSHYLAEVITRLFWPITFVAGSSVAMDANSPLPYKLDSLPTVFITYVSTLKHRMFADINNDVLFNLNFFIPTVALQSCLSITSCDRRSWSAYLSLLYYVSGDVRTFFLFLVAAPRTHGLMMEINTRFDRE
jgi:hypothetical protein